MLATSSVIRKEVNERQVYVAERSISQAKPERLLSAAADIRPPNLSGSTQSGAVAHPVTVNVSRCPGV